MLILKLFDTPLVRFTAARTLDGIELKIHWYNSEQNELLPLGMEPTEASLEAWLKHRAIPANRAYVQNFLSKNGLNEKDYIGILRVCKGLSLTDSYWVTEEEDTKTFAQMNLFENRFSKVLASIAFTGVGSSPNSRFRSSPEFTTNGMLPKAWRRMSGRVLLYKGGTSGFANTGKEPFSEFYAAQIAQAMGLEHVPYDLARWKGQMCSICALFTDKNTAFVPAAALIREKGIRKVMDFYEEHGWSDAFADMVVLDAVIRNTDRHLGNFGFLADSKTNRLIGPAPLFDHGLSLYCYVMDSDLDNLEEQDASLSPALYADFDEMARLVMGPRQREALRHLLTFRFGKHSRYNLSPDRLKRLEQAIRRRAAELLKTE